MVVRILPKTVRYICYDNDPQKLKGFKRGELAHYSVLGDGAQTCFKDHSVDWALCLAMSHHLTDEQLPLLISELARVLR